MAGNLISSEGQPTQQNDGAFVRVRFAGGRFEQHAIPFSMLPELDAYRGLIVEVAKHLFFKNNPDRKRVPKGFSESFELALSGLVTGNSATALARRLPVNMPRVQAALDFANYIEFEEARDLVDQVMINAARNENLPEGFPAILVEWFNRIGQGLGPTEFLEFSHGSSVPVKYDSSARKRIVLSGYPTYEAVVDQRFLLNGGNVQKKVIHLLAEDGRPLDLQAKNDDDLERAIGRRRNHVRLVGVGQFTREDQLSKITDYVEIIHSDDEPQLSYALRLQEISKTEPGWYSPGNPAPSRQSIARMQSFLAEAVEHWGIPFPFIFPTPEGGVRAEWSRGDIEISATVGEDGSVMKLNAFNVVSDHEHDAELDLDSESYPESFNNFWTRLESEEE